ncbi:spermatogenesis-associated protein 7 homolog isoform X4 [Scyliorhinus canicula]|uniref:spermatogenesis-associated protein 7 homolog isoform X4 n=1 Tax=Scyliorhinus canicula TaxID=7830 RepID=UPI0018F3EC90|nr:spermatogenesis-associated protein 7 homolog isoform X4 [Scyliorhinus canicula]
MTPFCIIKCTEGIIAGLQSAMIPKYSLMGPFKGHMCTKSSPFCLGSSCKLSTQFIIQDHMAVHYKNLLSTKAAVDSSMPKSMSTSIKYIDQQKRERLKKVVKKYQEETPLHPSTSQMNDRSVSLATTRFMDKDLMKRPFQDPQKKTFSGDILDKHSNQFTEEIQPFTPRTLKNTAKSFLSKYRYYKAPKKTQDNPGAAKMFQQNSSEANINREDEMKYLQFLKEVTDDILIRGYHSNKILENVFQTHIERSKYHLSEGKLKNILQNLRNELQTDPAVNYSEHSTAAQKTWLLAKNIHRTHTPVR